jgi:hypothetical protein
MIKVHFPEQDNFLAHVEDVEIDPIAAQICPGSYVRIRADVSEPTFGWGNLTKHATGQVMEISYDANVIVLFEFGAWRGLLAELEYAADAQHIERDELMVGPLLHQAKMEWVNLGRNMKAACAIM